MCFGLSARWRAQRQRCEVRLQNPHVVQHGVSGCPVLHEPGPFVVDPGVALKDAGDVSVKDVSNGGLAAPSAALVSQRLIGPTS